MRVRMVPHLKELGAGVSGIHTVIQNYFKHLPHLGVTLVEPDDDDFDLMNVHAGMTGRYIPNAPIVSSLHGLYWTADLPYAQWMYKANKLVVESIRAAREVTVPSAWVNETLARDMHFKAHVVPHGIDAAEWENDYDNEGYIVAYAKNRAGVDVSSPATATELARRMPDLKFVATFADQDPPNNLHVTGLMSQEAMKSLVMQAAVYISPVKETFGLGALEAMAAGVPVLTVNVGQVPHLVQHGVGGYCYNPHSQEDMIAGLRYCLQYRDQLGENARELSRQYSWEKSVAKLHSVYEKALEPREGTVDVVIPVYNKEINDVRRAIDSCIEQQRPPNRIIVVDDGSDNGGDVREAVEEYAKRGQPVEYYRQSNQGVAHARNHGIKHASGDYIVCLDADDAIRPEFIQRCAQALDKDDSLWLAYTKLQWVKPDGSTGVSEWPGEHRYDGFLERQNQVPTCCMFRRELHRRLGGYRQRYAPTGAGAEDAEFFARAGGFGYKAKLVTKEPLFVYSWMSGHTAQEGYREVDWMRWHEPWLIGKHPFASYATPQNGISHPVRQYDEPEISIIIPVGLGHEQEVVNALDSLEAQTYTKWEAVVVWNTGEDHVPDDLVAAYPFVRWFTWNTTLGAGSARNFGVDQSRGKMLLFLDADDWLYPQFLGKAVTRWNETREGVYTDYVGLADVDDVSKLAPNLQKRVLHQDRRGTAIGYEATEFDCEKAQRQPEPNRPYIWCNITTLIPKRWHDEVGGFDEKMGSWEDVDYWWRMARAGKCFTRIAEPLLVYRFNTGSRRDHGLKSHKQLIKYIQDKYKDGETEMCGCRQGTQTPTSLRAATLSSRSTSINGGFQSMDDQNFMLVEYNHPNRGQHPVVGPATKTKYGYRAGGDTFLVHKDDVQMASNLFKPVREVRQEQVAYDPQPQAPPPPPKPKPSQPEPVTEEVTEQPSHTPLDVAELDLSKRVMENLARKGVVTEERVLELGIEGLTKVKWVGEATAEAIYNHVKKQRMG